MYIFFHIFIFLIKNLKVFALDNGFLTSAILSYVRTLKIKIVALTQFF